MTRVGIVGVGAMGGAIAANLLEADFEVVGFDIDAERLAQLRERGGKTVGSPGEVAAGTDVVIMSLPSIAVFEQVTAGANGIRSGAPDGLVVIEASTLPLVVKKRGRRILHEHGVELLDCPLSGTSDQAKHKDVIVLASGDRAAVEANAAVFEGFARACHYLGEFGAGSKMKFIANLLVGIHNVAAAEAFVLGRKAGLDPEQLLKVISDSAGTSRMFEIRVPKMIHQDYTSGVSTRVFQKDLVAISEFARELDCPTPLFAASAQFYAAALARGYADQDTASVCAVLEAMAGTGGS